MDTAAFEVNELDEITLTELYHELPGGLRYTIGVVRTLGSIIAKLLLLNLAACGLIASFCLNLGWVASFWLLTRLFLITAALLRTVYNEPDTIQNESSLKAAPGSLLAGDSLSQRSVETPMRRPSHQITAEADARLLSAADINSFEKAFDSAVAPHACRRHSANATQENSAGNRNQINVERISTMINGVPEAIVHEEQERTAVMPTGSAQHPAEALRSTWELTPHEEEPFEDLQATGRSEAKQPQRKEPTTSIRGQTKRTNTVTSQLSTPGINLLPKLVSKEERKKAENSAFVAKFHVGGSKASNDNDSHLPATLSFSDSQHTSHPTNAAVGKHVEGFAPSLRGDANGLAEALEFARTASRGKNSGVSQARPLRRIRKATAAPQPSGILDPRTFAKAAASPSEEREAPWNPTYPPGFVPPHLRKAQAAKASHPDHSEEVPKRPDDTTVTPVTTYEVSKPARYTSNIPFMREDWQERFNTLVHRTTGGLSSEETRTGTSVTPSAVQSKVTDPSEGDPLRGFTQGLESSVHAQSTTLPRRLSFEQLLAMDADERARTRTSASERPHDAARSVSIEREPTPTLSRPAKHSLSAETLKSLRNSSPPANLDKRIAKANYIISGKANAALGSSSPSSQRSQRSGQVQQLKENSQTGLEAAKQDKSSFVRGNAASNWSLEALDRFRTIAMKNARPTSSSKQNIETSDSKPQQDFDDAPSADIQRSDSLDSVSTAFRVGAVSMSRTPSVQKLDSPRCTTPSPESEARAETAHNGISESEPDRSTAMPNQPAVQQSSEGPVLPVAKQDTLRKSSYLSELMGLDIPTVPLAVQTPPKPLQKKRLSSLMPQAPSFFAPLSAATTNRRAVTQPMPIQQTSSYDGRTEYAGSYHTDSRQLSIPAYDEAYSNPYQDMSHTDWNGHTPYIDFDMYPRQVGAVLGQASYNTAPDVSAYQTFSNVTLPITSPAGSVQDLHRRPIPSKAVKIEKPPEPKHDQRFPALPSKRKEPSQTQLRAPPGLSQARGAGQNTFDALLSEKAKTTSTSTFEQNFPALPSALNPKQQEARNTIANTNDSKTLPITSSSPLVNGNAVEQANVDRPADIAKEETNSEPATDHSEQSETMVTTDRPKREGDASWTEADTKSSLKKKRKTARAELEDLSRRREEIRRRQVATFTLDGARALKEVTKAYTAKRAELAKCMANGELSEDLASRFPELSVMDLSVPKRRHIPSNELASKTQRTDIGSIAKTEDVGASKIPAKKTDEELEQRKKAAIEARNRYVDAHAVFQRPHAKGNAMSKTMRGKCEARILLDRSYYDQKMEELLEAYGGDLPVEVSEKFWVYDDEAAKKSRDEWMTHES